MFAINLSTSFSILTISKLLLAILLFYLKFKIPSLKAIGYWALSCFLSALSTFVFSEFPYPASVAVDFVYSFLFNVLLIGGECFFLAGLWSFKNKSINRPVLWGFLLATTINSIVFSFFFPVLWIRLSINACLMFVLCFINALELWSNPRKSLNSLFKWSSFLYFFYAASQLLRFVAGVFFRPVNPLGNSTITIYLHFILGICIEILAYNLILIIMTYLNDEINEQLKAKNKLYAVIAHDIRNPLGNLSNYVSIFKQSHDEWDDIKVKSWIDDMDKMTSNSRILLENLLNWSKSQLNEIIVQPRINTLNQIINNVVVSLKPMVDNKKIRLLIQVKPETKAYFDADMIALVIRNLCTNAIKFTPANGTITISAITLSDKIEVAVNDDGIGIEKSKLTLIFDSEANFSSYGTNGEKGSGFGLPLCKEFVELNNGKIIVNSTMNVGSCFAFTLPISP